MELQLEEVEREFKAADAYLPESLYSTDGCEFRKTYIECGAILYVPEKDGAGGDDE